MKGSREIKLNINREQAAAFINFLANEGYWGNTLTYFDVEHGAEAVDFIINGHRLSNVSNQNRQVVIDHSYTYAGCVHAVYGLDGKPRKPIDHCLHLLEFED